MVDRDPPLEMNSLPSMKAEAKKQIKSAPPKHSPAPPAHKSSQSALWAAVAVLILLLVGLSYWNNLLQGQLREQSKTMQAAVSRITELEQRLSSTDETMSQSSISLQVHLKELKQRTDELWAQMDKLWASAWRRNQKDLADQSKALAKIQKEDSKQLGQINNLKTDLTALQARLEEIDLLGQQLGQQKSALVSTNKSIDKQKKALDQLKKQVEDNAGWVESNLGFRKQVNQKFDKLEKRVLQLQPAARPTL